MKIFLFIIALLLVSCSIPVFEKQHKTVVIPSQGVILEKNIQAWIKTTKNIDIIVLIKNKKQYIVFSHSKNDFELIKAMVHEINPTEIIQSNTNAGKIAIKSILLE